MAKPDPQRARIYAYEDEQGWDKSTISFKKTAALIQKACRLFGVQQAIVECHDTDELSYSQPELAFISMQKRGGLSPAIALHEAAHHITFMLDGYRVQDHGPKFLGRYIYLLEAFDVAPPNLRQDLHAAGLKWTEI